MCKFLIFLTIPFFSFSQIFSDFLPTATNNGQLVHHTYFSLSYVEKHEQPEWVFYEIKKEQILGVVDRKNNFRVDKAISTGSANLHDYRGSGYDRGHLAPAADFSFSNIAMSESFYMSNMSPQDPSFNRGIWKRLESLVRKWGANNNIYVVSGPILNDCSVTIGESIVCVPKYFYKVIYDSMEQRMIAFILPNEKGEKNIQEYVCSTDYLEQITNIDFFPILEDKIEHYLESDINKEKWDW
ncbi:MAG: DNA/RNA endonuclease [Flavobacteriales bacterium]|nr:DNA/RNA endonuclease [Flavobacteriales bacterium]|tara:strand:- start:109 stop:831 length:723 start_codon:yes stop_codon:yes gene_type:complete